MSGNHCKSKEQRRGSSVCLVTMPSPFLRMVVNELKCECEHRWIANIMEEIENNGNPQQFFGFNSQLRATIELCETFLDGRAHVECLIERLQYLQMLNLFAEIFVRYLLE